MEKDANKRVERCCELAGETTSALKPSETPCMDDRQFAPEDFSRHKREVAPTCARMVLKCLYLAKKWKTRSTYWHDQPPGGTKRLERLISYTNQTTLQTIWLCWRRSSGLELFSTLLLLERCKISQTSGGVLGVFGPRTIVRISWMCKKQAAVSHSSAESEIIALDATLRMKRYTSIAIVGLCSRKHVRRAEAESVIPPHILLIIS